MQCFGSGGNSALVVKALQAMKEYLKAKENQGMKGIPNIQKIIDDVESQLLVLK